MKRICFFLLGISILLTSCSDNSITPNEAIDESLRTEMKGNVEKLLGTIVEYDFLSFEKLLSVHVDMADARLENYYDSLVRVVKTSDFTVIDEYYLTYSGKANEFFIQNGGAEYSYALAANAEESYLAFLSIPGDEYELMMTLLYSKSEKGWLLDFISLGQYTVGPLMAKDLYKTAKDFYDDGKLLQSLTYCGLVEQCINPSDETFKYSFHDDYYTFSGKLFDDLNKEYKLPFTIKELDSKPFVFGVGPMLHRGEYTLYFAIVSNVDLGDRRAVRKEVDAIHPYILKHFHGLEKDRKRIVYTVYNQLPEEHRTGRRRTVEKELTK